MTALKSCINLLSGACKIILSACICRFRGHVALYYFLLVTVLKTCIFLLLLSAGSLAERLYPGCAVRVALSGSGSSDISSDHNSSSAGAYRFGTLLRETDSHTVRVRLDAHAIAAADANQNGSGGAAAVSGASDRCEAIVVLKAANIFKSSCVFTTHTIKETLGRMS